MTLVGLLTGAIALLVGVPWYGSLVATLYGLLAGSILWLRGPVDADLPLDTLRFTVRGHRLELGGLQRHTVEHLVATDALVALLTQATRAARERSGSGSVEVPPALRELL